MSVFRNDEDDELRLHNAVTQGRGAKALLTDEILGGAIAEVEMRFLEAWKESKTVDKREAAWAGVDALEKVRTVLREIQADGEHAETVLDEQNQE